MPATLEQTNGVTASALIRPDGREPEVVEFESAVVTFFVDAAEILGIPKSVAAIYGICFASDEPLSFADIEQKLTISKGSISQGLRVLRDVGALKVVSVTSIESASLSLLPSPSSRSHGRRCDAYEPDIELRKLVLHYLEQRVEKQLEAGKKRLQQIQTLAPRNDDRSGSKKLAARIKALNGWHAKSRALLPLIKGALKLT